MRLDVSPRHTGERDVTDVGKSQGWPSDDRESVRQRRVSLDVEKDTIADLKGCECLRRRSPS